MFFRIKQSGLKIKRSKCHLYRKQIHLLGQIISIDGVEVDPKKVAAVIEVKLSSNLKELREFLN